MKILMEATPFSAMLGSSAFMSSRRSVIATWNP